MLNNLNNHINGIELNLSCPNIKGHSQTGYDFNQTENFLRKAQEKAGYLSISTPHIGNKDLYVLSGHYEKYGEDSFQPIKTPSENEEFIIKPMNCPHHCEIYKSKK